MEHHEPPRLHKGEGRGKQSKKGNYSSNSDSSGIMQGKLYHQVISYAKKGGSALSRNNRLKGLLSCKNDSAIFFRDLYPILNPIALSDRAQLLPANLPVSQLARAR